MSYTENQWKILSERFNKQSFSGKLLLIKQNPDIFKLESDGYNFFLRLNNEDAMKSEFDLWFEFPQNFDYIEMKAVFSMFDLNLFPAK